MHIVDDPEFLRQFIDRNIYVISERKVTETESKVSQDAVSDPVHTYKGNNNAGIAVCIGENNTPEENKLLTDILKAVNLRVDEVALYEMGEEIKSSEFLDISGFKILISFGITSVNSVYLNIETKYSPTTVENCTVLIADPLSALQREVDLKKKLWAALKSMF